MSANYIDLSGSTFTVTPDGKYCFNLKSLVNGNTRTSQECFPITKDTYSDRVLCMTRSIMTAYGAYLEGTGATDINSTVRQKVYDEIIKQFLPTIKNWDLCDAQKFVSVYLSHVDQVLLKDSKISETMNQLGESIAAALRHNGCVSASDESSSSRQMAWYVWLLIILGVVAVLGAGWYGWKRYKTNQPIHKSPLSLRRRAR